eukprot:TRINITY_DN41646_c0_g1_i1.p1 TRINITY_DN41646_c0_g1~~TRINITY_DN41646_c0_g1_i1.p1  ORF type:complete len:150 (-),score=59.63 TRINITY_DN41646_c0_g1_i1:61-510(-)
MCIRDRSLQEYERLKCEQWAREVDASVAAKLKQPLLQRRAQDNVLRVNFDGALVRLLREVKYFLQLGLEVPDTAMAIYKKAEVFRTQTGNLELIVNKYNWTQANLLDVERPLVQQQSVSYTHLRAHETPEHLVCRLLLEKKKDTTLQYF